MKISSLEGLIEFLSSEDFTAAQFDNYKMSCLIKQAVYEKRFAQLARLADAFADLKVRRNPDEKEHEMKIEGYRLFANLGYVVDRCFFKFPLYPNTEPYSSEISYSMHLTQGPVMKTFKEILAKKNIDIMKDVLFSHAKCNPNLN